MDLPLLSELRQNAGENLTWLITSSALAAMLVGVIWWRAPAVILHALRWLDDQIPGDFSSLHRPISRLFTAALTLGVATLWAVAIIGALGGDVARARQLLAGVSAAAARWAFDEGLKVLLVVILALLLQRIASRAIPGAIQRYVRSRSAGEPEIEVQKDAATLSTVLGKVATVLVLIGALFMAMAQLGINLAPLLATAGVVGIAVGFGAQTLVRDILGGLFIILEKQYRVGDVVNIAGTGGLVEDINLRRTVLRDLDYTQHIIPNGEVRVASNLTRVKSRVNINIPVAYKEDLDRVIAVLNQVGQEMARDPVWEAVILDPPKVLRVDNFADSAVEIKVLGETQPIRQWDVMGEYRLRVKKAFDRLGIEIPYPHRTVYWGSSIAGPASRDEGSDRQEIGAGAPGLRLPDDGK